MTTKKKAGIFGATYLGVAAVWLGGHFGPGFATGAFSAQYYVTYGWIGLVMPLLAMLLTGGVMFFMAEYARSYGTTNYKPFVESAFGGTFGKVMAVFYDVLFIGTVIGAGGLAFSGEANILSKVFGIGYWAAAIPTVIVSVLLCLFGSKLVAMSSKYMMYAIVVIVVLIAVLSLIFGNHDISAAFSAPPIETRTPTIIYAVWKAILYGCFQSTIAFNVMGVADLLESRNDTKKAIISGYIITVVLMILIAFTLFIYIPVNPNIINLSETPVPMMAILGGLGMPWLTYIFVILMTLAVLTSTAGLANAGCRRFDSLFKGIKNPLLRKAVITIILLGIAAAAASLNMAVLTRTVTTYIGYFGIIGLVIPAFTIIRSKLKKFNAQKAEAETAEAEIPEAEKAGE